VTVPPPDEPPPDGYVFIDSYPKGMQIFMDNKERRRITPDSITWLSEKEYKFTLKHPFFRDTSFYHIVSENEKESLFVDYRLNKKMLSNLELNSFPEGASIYINDSVLAEKTPFTITDQLPGYYKVRYSYPNHRDAETVVLLTSGITGSVFLPLLDLSTWHEYTAETSGLKTDRLKCIEMDMRGDIWIGTEDHGIYRIEGSSFKNYSRNNSPVLCNDVNDICFGPNGMTYIATAEMGIVVFPERIFGQNKNHEWQFWTTEDTITTLPDNNVTSIALGENGRFWFGTKNGLLSVTPEGASYLTRIYNSANSEIQENYITDVAAYEDELWVATKSGGFLIFGNNIWQLYATFNSDLRSNNINKIFPLGPSKAYLGLSTKSHFTPGLALFDNGSVFGEYFDMPDNNVFSIYKDSESRIWVGTETSIIVFDIWDNRQVYTYENTGLNIKDIRGFIEDTDGTILIVSNGGGLFRYLK
jgi:hypothetical protein